MPCSMGETQLLFFTDLSSISSNLPVTTGIQVNQLRSHCSHISLTHPLLGSLHSPVPLSCAGVNESLFVQLLEDEKCNGRALLLLPGMKSSIPNPTVLCLATGCHSCSTHNAADIRKESAYPAAGNSHISRAIICSVKSVGLLRDLGSSPVFLRC